MPLALASLVLAQLPLAAAFVLTLPNAGSEHEVVASFDRGAVHLSLRHQSTPDRLHRHHGCERLLLGESGSEHPDHEFLAGSSEEISELNSGCQERPGDVEAAWLAMEVCLGIECRSESLCHARRSAPPPLMPAMQRRGVVMRH